MDIDEMIERLERGEHISKASKAPEAQTNKWGTGKYNNFPEVERDSEKGQLAQPKAGNIWRVFSDNNGELEAVKEGFNWWAFLFVGVWACVKGLPVAGLLGLIAAMFVNRLPADTGIVAVPLACILMGVYGFWGNQWVSAKLQRNKYRYIGQVVATNKDDAICRANSGAVTSPVAGLQDEGLSNSVHATSTQHTDLTCDSFEGATIDVQINEKAIYEKIAIEFEADDLDKGMWIKLYALNEGDAVKTKVAYIKERATYLIEAERANSL